MYEGLEGEKHILHFLDDRIQMQHVYCIPNKRQETILPTVKNFEALITRHWDHRFRICKSDNEAGLGNAFDQWVIQNGFTHEKSPTHTPEQNGAINALAGLSPPEQELLSRMHICPSIYGLRFTWLLAISSNPPLPGH